MATILITGANRGIGLELTRQYAADGWRVHACCRDPRRAEELYRVAAGHDVIVHPLEVTKFSAIELLAQQLRGEAIDILINNAGVFGPKAGAESDPRQSFGHFDFSIWRQVLDINLLAPMKMAEAFVEHLALSKQKKLVTLSSTMGSLAETSGGVYAYRTSKAAVNMAMATLAQDLKPRGISVLILCPGWVQTDMGGARASLTAAESVHGMRARIAELNSESSGQFRRYNGEKIDW